MKVFLLSGGLLDAQRSVIHPEDDSGRRVSLPVMQVLLQHEGKNVLVDTGLPPQAAGDPDALARDYDMDRAWIAPLGRGHERVDEQLRRLGLAPTNLDLVINTHLHFDHAGGNALFTGPVVAVQEAEVIAARETPGYLPIWDAPGLRFRSVEGDWSPLPGVTMLHTPGHTPGHQSMLVELEPQPWLFTWDAVYTEEHWREHRLGAVRDVTEARRSVDRLRQVAAERNARIIFGHDIGQWEALGMLPDGEPRLVASS